MQDIHFSTLFIGAVLASVAVRLWLVGRQVRHVAAHRATVPSPFVQAVPLAAHQKAADYTMAQARFGLVSLAFGTAVLLGWTLLGGLDALNQALRDVLLPAWGPLGYQLGLLSAFMVVGGLIEAPLSWWQTFRIEQAFGFNRMTLKLWLLDGLKGTLLSVVIGLPLAALILWIMGASGGLWWLWAWLAWVAFNLVLMVLYPTVIAPLFNKFDAAWITQCLKDPNRTSC